MPPSRYIPGSLQTNLRANYERRNRLHEENLRRSRERNKRLMILRYMIRRRVPQDVINYITRFIR